MSHNTFSLMVAELYCFGRRPIVIPMPYQPPQSGLTNGATPTRKKQKKGPKRIRKTVQDLDMELDQYIAGRAIPQTT